MTTLFILTVLGLLVAPFVITKSAFAGVDGIADFFARVVGAIFGWLLILFVIFIVFSGWQNTKVCYNILIFN